MTFIKKIKLKLLAFPGVQVSMLGFLQLFVSEIIKVIQYDPQ